MTGYSTGFSAPMNLQVASSLEVIDPCNRTGKIVVPIEYITETIGINEQNRPKESRDLSLCLLFQKGRCNAGARCHQVHADPAFVNKLRTQAAAGTACCALHGDFQSSHYLSLNRIVHVAAPGQVSVAYSLNAFGRTATLDSMLNGTASSTAPIRVFPSKICRLHSEGRCKFGKDCKNVHMCPNAKPIQSQPDSSSVSSLASSLNASTRTCPAPLSGFTMPQPRSQRFDPLADSSATTAASQSQNSCSRDPLELSSFLRSPKKTAKVAENTFAVTSSGAAAPATPDQRPIAPYRSNSVASSVGPATSASTSPSDSPKERGLWNRTGYTAPAPLFSERALFEGRSAAPKPLAPFTLPAASSSTTPAVSVTEKVVDPFLSGSTKETANWSIFDSLLAMPSLSVTSISSPFSAIERESSAASSDFHLTVSQLASDFSKMQLSPSWRNDGVPLH